MSLLSIARGNSFVVENIFEDRFNHVGELRRMGASITLSGRAAMIEGVERLRPAPLYATDLRAGAALIIAALMAEGESHVYNIEYVDRGYEYLEQKLSALGADICRVCEPARLPLGSPCY
ncbi:UDP-N-acetylglucosamine 1-carboxyvinyltransferase [bioreactor metagenome]|uniref:UDP-N-acetylglucosamine 1-carboxyvinyltransferase n=1 Tax=bioreactor metagenome TaxID=1076179 RepID=A0A645FN21_9ZZZZ